MNVLDFSEIEKSPYTKIVISDHCPLHCHTFFEFSICFEGNYTNVINGTNLKICKGSVILLRPQDAHYFIKGANHTHRDIYITKEKMKEICDTMDVYLFDKLSNEPLAINFMLPLNELESLDSELNFFNNISDKPALCIQATYIKIITKILCCWQNVYLQTTVHYPEWLHFLLNNLNSQQFLSKNINEIIKSTNYSHGHVCREFKKYLKTPLQQYVADLKFSYACALLSNKENTMNSIALKLNYGSTSNFLIAFKRKFGITPSQWRNQNI